MEMFEDHSECTVFFQLVSVEVYVFFFEVFDYCSIGSRGGAGYFDFIASEGFGAELFFLSHLSYGFVHVGVVYYSMYVYGWGFRSALGICAFGDVWRWCLVHEHAVSISCFREWCRKCLWCSDQFLALYSSHVLPFIGLFGLRLVQSLA